MKIRSLFIFVILFLGFNSSQSLLGRIGSGDFQFKNNTAFRIKVKYCKINNLKKGGNEVVEPKSTGQEHKWGLVSVFVKEIKFQDLDGKWNPAMKARDDKGKSEMKISGTVKINCEIEKRKDGVDKLFGEGGDEITFFVFSIDMGLKGIKGRNYYYNYNHNYLNRFMNKRNKSSPSIFQ